MHNRLRLLQGATALLYFGPLLAGLGGFGWAVVPLFFGIFMLWQFILRPQQWPRTWADWQRPEALIALLTQGVVQLLLVAISFGIGRGIGGVLGALPPFPLMLPVGISFLSIPLARMIWDPWAADGAMLPMDSALADVQAGAPTEAALGERVAVAGRMVEELQHLAADTPDEVLARHLAAMGTQVTADALRVALLDPIYDGSASALHRRAAVIHATTGAVADALAGSAYAMAVFRETTDDRLLALFAQRAAAMVAEVPARVADCPDPVDVRAEAERAAMAAAPLEALAKALEAGHARLG